MLRRELISLLIVAVVVMTIYAAEAYLIAGFILNKIKGLPAKRFRSKLAIVIHLFAVTGIICIIYGHFIEPFWIQKNILEIPTSKLHQTSLRIVQISDLHCEKNNGVEKKVVEMVNESKPDIVVFTGDALNTAKALPLFKETMKDINAPLGKFAVYGNYDVHKWRNLDLYGSTGFKLLDINFVELKKDGERFCITGLNSEQPNKLLIPQDCLNIIICHQPYLIDKLKDANIDLYLCGHTHGGQIALPFYGAVITMSESGKKYERGKYMVASTILYVNRGIGMDDILVPRMRFLSRPEITVFDIKPDGNYINKSNNQSSKTASNQILYIDKKTNIIKGVLFNICDDSNLTIKECNFDSIEDKLERYLRKENQEDNRCKELAGKFRNYKRQYVGHIVNGKNIIFINFFCQITDDNWKNMITEAVLDGGDCYFHVEYNPQTEEFSNLSINGEA